MRIPGSAGLVGAIVVIAGTMALLSCGGGEKGRDKLGEKVAERAIKSATGQDVDIETDGKSVKIQGEGQSAELAATAVWPSDMFEGVPEFTFGKIERVTKGEEGGMMKFNVFLRDLKQGNAEKYIQNLRRAGWQADLTPLGPKAGLVTAQKGNYGMNFAFNTEQGTGMIAVFTAIH